MRACEKWAFVDLAEWNNDENGDDDDDDDDGGGGGDDDDDNKSKIYGINIERSDN